MKKAYYCYREFAKNYALPDGVDRVAVAGACCLPAAEASFAEACGDPV